MKDKYQKYCDQLGHKLHISGRVIKYIRDSYYDKYLEAEWGDIFFDIIRVAKRKIEALERDSRTERLELIKHLSAQHASLRTSTFAVNRIIKLTPRIVPYIDKLGLYKSIICFSNRLTEDQFKLIIKEI